MDAETLDKLKTPVAWSNSYYILCYAKTRFGMQQQKLNLFTLRDFWEFRGRRPKDPSHLNDNFKFLVKQGFLNQRGNQYEITDLGEHALRVTRGRAEKTRKAEISKRMSDAHWTNAND